MDNELLQEFVVYYDMPLVKIENAVNDRIKDGWSVDALTPIGSNSVLCVLYSRPAKQEEIESLPVPSPF